MAFNSQRFSTRLKPAVKAGQVLEYYTPLLQYYTPLLQKRYAHQVGLAAYQKVFNTQDMEVFLKRYENAGLFRKTWYFLNYRIVKSWPSLQSLREVFVYQRFVEINKSLRNEASTVQSPIESNSLWLPRGRVFAPLYLAAVTALQQVNKSRKQLMYDIPSLPSMPFSHYSKKNFMEFFGSKLPAEQRRIMDIAYRKLINLFQQHLKKQAILLQKHSSPSLEQKLTQNRKNMDTDYEKIIGTLLNQSRGFQESPKNADQPDPFKGLIQIGGFMHSACLETAEKNLKEYLWLKKSKPVLENKLAEIEKWVDLMSESKSFSASMLWAKVSKTGRLYEEFETLLQEIDKNHIPAEAQRIKKSKQKLIEVRKDSVKRALDWLDQLHEKTAQKIDALAANETQRSQELMGQYNTQAEPLLNLLKSEVTMAWQADLHIRLSQRRDEHIQLLQDQIKKAGPVAQAWLALNLESSFNEMKIAENDPAMLILEALSSRYTYLSQTLEPDILTYLNKRIAHYLRGEYEDSSQLSQIEGNMLPAFIQDRKKQLQQRIALKQTEENLNQRLGKCMTKLLLKLEKQPYPFNLSLLQSELHVIGEKYTKCDAALDIKQAQHCNNTLYQPLVKQVEEQTRQLKACISLVRDWKVDQDSYQCYFGQDKNKKYRALSLKYHPDKHQDPLLKRLADAIFKQLNKMNPLSKKEELVKETASEREASYYKRGTVLFQEYKARINAEYAVLHELSLKELKQVVAPPVSTLNCFYKEHRQLMEEVDKDGRLSSNRMQIKFFLMQYSIQITSLEADLAKTLALLKYAKEESQKIDQLLQKTEQSFKEIHQEIDQGLNRLEESFKEMRQERDQGLNRLEESFKEMRQERDQGLNKLQQQIDEIMKQIGVLTLTIQQPQSNNPVMASSLILASPVAVLFASNMNKTPNVNETPVLHANQLTG